MANIPNSLQVPPVSAIYPGAKDFYYDDTKHEYGVNGIVYPGCTSLFKEFGLVDDRFYTPRSRDLGKAIHATTHYHDDGNLDENTVMPEIMPYLASWKNFRSEWGFKPMPELREKWMISFIHKYGVIPDSVGMCKDWGLTVVEIKSGQLIKKCVHLQTAAQAIAIEENYKLFVNRRLAVQLKPEGYKVYECEVKDNRRDRQDFLSMVNVHWLKLR